MEVWEIMKIFQIENGFVHWDATPVVPDLDWAASHYAPNIVFVEAPDYVHEGWIYDDTKEGDDRFVPPEPPQGWLYDERTGTFYQEGAEPPAENTNLKSVFASIINSI